MELLEIRLVILDDHDAFWDLNLTKWPYSRDKLLRWLRASFSNSLRTHTAPIVASILGINQIRGT